ncbi:hypothetical protein [Paenibacillus koleovorans]|uniref:hypothetical protein n=1 Tax=Paenibacillus koleovorans TaxID=121608 RepID=UPI000FD6D44A|nr:hypothetical protein [Paenibacillus koleovorans]
MTSRSPRTKHIPMVLAAAISFFILVAFFLPPQSAHACSPAPWSLEDAYKAEAMVHGKVVSTSKEGRQATIDVLAYVGPEAGPTPKKIRLPATVDARPNYPAGYACPDFSMKFQPGEEYVFFLADVSPRLALFAPSWITASRVENGLVYLTNNGAKDSLQLHLSAYAVSKEYRIATPTANGPFWGKGPAVPRGFAILLVLTAILACSYRQTKQNPATGDTRQ